MDSKNSLATFKAAFDNILRNSQAEGRKFVSYKKYVAVDRGSSITNWLN